MIDLLCADALMRAVLGDEQWTQHLDKCAEVFGFNRTYPQAWVQKTCLSCGSKTQPCCGH